jgi:hypothetical protein
MLLHVIGIFSIIIYLDDIQAHTAVDSAAPNPHSLSYPLQKGKLQK